VNDDDLRAPGEDRSDANADAGRGDPVEHLWNAAHEFLAAAGQ
jgi:hypothetical protein